MYCQVTSACRTKARRGLRPLSAQAHALPSRLSSLGMRHHGRVDLSMPRTQLRCNPLHQRSGVVDPSIKQLLKPPTSSSRRGFLTNGNWTQPSVRLTSPRRPPSSTKPSSSTRRHPPRQTSRSSASSGPASSSHLSMTQRLQQFFLTPRVIPFPRWITPRHFTITISEVCGHLSFLLVFCSYAVDDFLMLRIIAVAGSTSILFFSYFHPYGRPLWLPMKWNILFIAVNSYRIGNVLMDVHRADNLSEEMLQIHADHFHVIELVDFAKLVQLGEIEEFAPGETLLQQGEWNDKLRLVLEGELDVFRDGHLTYTLEEGNFISESGLHAGLALTGPVEASGTVRVKQAPQGKTIHTHRHGKSRGHTQDGSTTNTRGGGVRCLRWNRTELIRLLEREKSLQRTFQSALSWDVVSKLKGQRVLLLRKNTKPDEVLDYRRSQSEFRYLAILHNILKVAQQQEQEVDTDKSGRMRVNNSHDENDKRKRGEGPFGGLHVLNPSSSSSSTAAAASSSTEQVEENLEKYREEINMYRMIHHITDEQHRKALAQCGWTPEEFEAGTKNGTKKTTKRRRSSMKYAWLKERRKRGQEDGKKKMMGDRKEHGSGGMRRFREEEKVHEGKQLADM